jgi:hypothetical protein
MLTVTLILAVLALLLAIASAVNRAPLWVAVTLLAIVELLHVLPR